jgi:hypothetical protein
MEIIARHLKNLENLQNLKMLPVLINELRVTNDVLSAMLQRSEINGFEHHRLFRLLGNPCLVTHRVSRFETPTGWYGGWLVAGLS